MHYRLGSHQPQIGEHCYVAPSASLIGQVILDEAASVWFQATLRGDNEPIRIGARSNVQDGAVLHTDPGAPLTLGVGVSVGHGAVLHGCEVGDHSLIGIGAIVLNHARIGPGCLIGAGALITEGKEIPAGSLVVGSPGRVLRALTEAEQAGLRANAEAYVARTLQYRESLQPIGDAIHEPGR